MEAHDALVLETEFLENVTVTLRLKDEEVQAFTNTLGNLSSGQVEPIVVEQNPESVFPLA